MCLANRVGGWSVTKIGKFHNGRHHTTVCCAICRIEALGAMHAEVDSLLKALAEEIKSGPASDSHGRIHVLGRPAAVQLVRPMAITEELVDALAGRLTSRPRSTRPQQGERGVAGEDLGAKTQIRRRPTTGNGY
jgi:hypothetical protein